MIDIKNYENIEKYKKFNMPYIERDLSWLDFNRRVLSCGCDKKVPINERANFIGITESNLDEFISVRYPSSDDDNEKGTKSKLLKDIKKFIKDRDEVVKNFISILNTKYNVRFTVPEKLSKKEYAKLEKLYHNDIFPLLSIEKISEHRIDNGYPFIAALIRDNDVTNTFIIPIIKELDTLYITDDGSKVITIEDIITHFLASTTFINKKIVETGVYRIHQDGSVIISHDSSINLITRMEDTLLHRMNAKPIFIQYREGSGEKLLDEICDHYGINNKHRIRRFMIDYKSFKGMKFVKGGNYKKFKPKRNTECDDIFDTLDKEDIMLHHPYDSYDTVVDFVRQAADDKYVISIKQSLYRVSSLESPIVEALCKASRRGKKVLVLVEIKARFDERNNIEIFNKLSAAGCVVTLGDEFKKTHCKMCTVVRRKPGDGTKVYTHIGTGNYNEATSKIYTDISYLTSSRKLGHDVTEIFNIVLGYSKPVADMYKLFYSPVNLRNKIIACIDNEIKQAKNGKKAEIIMKVNSISDKAVISRLYTAANKGVKVTIITRGICSILPRKNLYIKSIVGRFLEHSRIYYFRNKKEHNYYISSADLLPRNLDKRVEILLSMNNKEISKKISKILSLMMNDTENSFIMTKDGKWIKCNDDKKFDCHQMFIDRR